MTLPTGAAIPKRILVPVDLSESSLQILDVASSLADAFDAKLTLLHVWELPPFAQVESYDVVTGPDRRPLKEYVRAEAEAKLAKVLADRSSVERKVILGTASETIVKVARPADYDLVVVGTHGRGGLARIALGSVAEKVVRSSPVPVLVVPTGHRRKARS